MPSFSATIPSSWTAEETFDYLADFRSVAEWDPSMQSATLVSGSPGAVGAFYDLVMSSLGKEATLHYECVELTRPTRFVMRCETNGYTSTDTVTVDANANVTYDAVIDLKGVRKLIAPLMQGGLALAGTRARDGLSERLANTR